MDSNAEIVNAEEICVNGNYEMKSNSDSNPLPTANCPTSGDPYVSLPEPEEADDSCDENNYELNSNDEDTLDPGVYCGGIKIKSNAEAFFSPGIYIIKNEKFLIDSNASVEGDNVFFYLTGNNAIIDFDSNASVDLSAPTSGTYEGILFFQDRDNSGIHYVDSNANASLWGALYFPNGEYYSDSNATLGDGGSGCLQIVAKKVTFNSNSGLDFTPDTENCPLYNGGVGGEVDVVLVQ